ncbi:hypothetical protein BD410DRAFT_898545 [Rickenella mellea]|uniref:ubiquitinyl hydrolase 1 n=1 Tax=Rickenella mellea TaxID=50990 RepID=A0A4Y7Q4V5_9AGAM|nr:hypothetical protein BD410DRAFT_898545 [Rickenella mellea]
MHAVPCSHECLCLELHPHPLCATIPLTCHSTSLHKMTDMKQFKYVVNNIFMPPKLPQKGDDDTHANDMALASMVATSAGMYCERVPQDEISQWKIMVAMVEQLVSSQEAAGLSKSTVMKSLKNLRPGGILAFFIHAQNSGIIIRKGEDSALIECFEVSPTAAAVTGTIGKLLCYYPASAVSVPLENFDDESFRHEFANFLSHMDVDILEDALPVTKKAGSRVTETRDTADPRYITQLLVGILRGIGKPVDFQRIQKRIGDEVLWDNANLPWRRSSLWLVIRVALQTSLSSAGDTSYKSFMAFLMSDILRAAVPHGLDSDLLHCMGAKVARRLFKIGDAAPDFVVEHVSSAVEEIGKVLNERWQSIQKDHVEALTPRWAPDELDFQADTELSLHNSKDYISQVLDHSFSPIVRDEFVPHEQHRNRNTSEFRDFLNDYYWSTAFDADPTTVLADFEDAVRNNLDAWVGQNLHKSNSYDVIGECITRYENRASKRYESDPEVMSVMFLTIFHLWVGLDKISTTQFTLLRDYSPEIPLELMTRLLLRKSEQLNQLARIEAYLRGRSSAAFQTSSIFSDDINSHTIGIRCFSESDSLQELKCRIEHDADVERKNRCSELGRLNEKHRQLTTQAAELDHSSHWVYRKGVSRSVHRKKKCGKCKLEREASGLSISVHEWPLPKDELRAQAVVFELECPAPFRTWRNITYRILHNICGTLNSSMERVEPFICLENYPTLKIYYTTARDDWQHQITIASETKSFLVAHYRSQSIPTTESRICVNNGLHYRLFDRPSSKWAATGLRNWNIKEQCTLKISPTSPYHVLQSAVSDFPTSNEILANQSDCPKELFLHEFIAFGSIRSGDLLQWMNIVRELRARTLRFGTIEVHSLLVQSAWQVGPSTAEGNRVWHTELGDPEFGAVLIRELKNLIETVEDNWREMLSVRTIVFLATRLLAVTRDDKIAESVFTLLKQARKVTFQWMDQLAGKLQIHRSDEELSEFQWRICEMAATCRSTYDVDLIHLQKLLSSEHDVDILVQCAVTCHNKSPPDFYKLSSDRKQFLTRDRRLSYTLEKVLSTAIINQRRSGLDLAIRAIWDAYRPGLPWTQLPKPNDRWFVSRTAQGFGQKSQLVHYNVMDGQLLIDGKPLGCLPSDMVRKATYNRIFGQTVLDIIPSDMPGMEFKARHLISGYEVYLSPRESELVIRTKQPNTGDILELIPHNKLDGDLPQLLVQENVHWLHLSDRTIELRPLETLWISSPNNWHIHLPQVGRWAVYRPSSPSISLIDMRSRTFTMIAECVKPLERSQFVRVELGGTSDSLSIHLPRFKLSFFVNAASQIECQNLRGMVIDLNKSVGSLVGLSNQLVLRPQRDDLLALPQSRRVLIPHGELDFRQDGHHVQVNVATNQDRHVRYYEYKIDKELGCLVGSVNLTNRLHLLYLHALTSHCLPDPLTGRTGTEEALHGLRSASCFSFQKLDDIEAKILNQIGSLTAVRTHYPSHLRSMQTVKWARLPPTAQHHGFHAGVKSIFAHAECLSVFHDGVGIDDYASDNITNLLDRAALRNAIFYPVEFSGPLRSDDVDLVYDARDLPTTHDELLVYGIASSLRISPSLLNVSRDLMGEYEKWEELSGPIHQLDLTYSRDWLRMELRSHWLSLYDKLIQSPPTDHNQVIFSLSALAFASPDFRPCIDTFQAFWTVQQFCALPPPKWPSYSLQYGFEPQSWRLSPIVRSCAIPFGESPEASLPKGFGETDYELSTRRYSAYAARIDDEIPWLIDALVDQWPCEQPRRPIATQHPSFDLQQLMESEVIELFRHWYRNMKLRSVTFELQAILDNVCTGRATDNIIHPLQLLLPIEGKLVKRKGVSFEDVLKPNAPIVTQLLPLLEIPTTMATSEMSVSTENLRNLLAEFAHSPNALWHRYGLDLDESRKSLYRHDFPVNPKDNPYKEWILILHREQCRSEVHHLFSAIVFSLWYGMTKSESILRSAGLLPRITPKFLIEKLAFTSQTSLPSNWKSVLMSFAEALLGYQRSQRLLGYSMVGNVEEFWKELKNTGQHDLRKSEFYADWLLIQIEGNFLVRPIQARVGVEMIAPSSGENSVHQLVMGEGKSSVIVPLVASALADRTKLVRVVVLKPLVGQMFQLLIQRLSGLTNRRIFYMPFSRAVKMDLEQARRIQEMYETCMRLGGILVAQPEHMLSFKLMGIDKALSGAAEASSLLNSQIWLEANSRDILDESDEILHVRYQLIYTAGTQRPVEDHPDRWVTIQEVLSLARMCASEVLREHPRGLEFVEGRSENFDPIRIHSLVAGERLVDLIAKNILDGAMPNFTFELFPEDVRQGAFKFITDPKHSKSQVATLQEYCHDTDGGLWKAILLLRGLFAHGILIYVFKERRWRVDYGLDPNRSLLAVPYLAKDVPAVKAEFGHPDVCIALTCLSYYYLGLTKDQVDSCFQSLYKLDNPVVEYDKWVRASESIPESLRQLNGVNTEDPDLYRSKIVPLFSRNFVVINFFLSHIVFPKEAKEFPMKLSTSGWDIAERKTHVTTGFSGTNDNRYLLPASIKQQDPAEQLSTNAKVLNYLLRPENSVYVCAQTNECERLSAESFLELLVQQKPEVRILLDVGAQMLELRNERLALHWLSLHVDAQATLFFNDHDELVVITRDGTIETFVASPFNQQLDQCLVYLDDAHTRGTDLKLPHGSRAAVTLGPKVTKDRLSQGCMRMRGLGSVHSVMFMGPPEVDRSIRNAMRYADERENTVEVRDILRWVMQETCAEIERSVPRWAQQGIEYYARSNAWKQFTSHRISEKELCSSWLTPEAKTLDMMYGMQTSDSVESSNGMDIPEITSRCRELGAVSSGDNRNDEEQEREIQHEIEVEREVQLERPPKAVGSIHSIHADVKTFIRTGRVPIPLSRSSAFVSAFVALKNTRAATLTHELGVWSERLLATADFLKTIKTQHFRGSDEYLRPVQWIISSTVDQEVRLVIASPFEVNVLLPEIRRSDYVHLHIYTPRVTQAMGSCDDLTLYCIPPLPRNWPTSPLKLLTIQLNVFAGQLYLADYETYLDVCQFLGVYSAGLRRRFEGAPDLRINCDGFVNRRLRIRVGWHQSPFERSPLPFLKELFALRRKGINFLPTHLGQILHGKSLAESKENF